MDPTVQEVLKLDSEGMATPEIAEALKLSEKEVEWILAKRRPGMDLTDQEREALKLAADEEVAAIRRAMFKLLRKRHTIPPPE